MNRRQLLKSGSLLTAGLLAAPCISVGFNGREQLHLGIILSTLKIELRKDPEEVFKQLAKIGYRYVESIGRYGFDAEQTMKYVRKYELTPVTTGDAMEQLHENSVHYLKIAQKYSIPYIVCYYPWTTDIRKLTIGQCLETAEKLEKLGEKFSNEGFRFAWHNHDKEFYEIEGTDNTPFDIIMANTSPEFVKSELDIYWVKFAGKDPLKVLDENKNRVGLLHLKDMMNDSLRSKTCPGNGIIDFKPFLERKSDVDYLIVEEESSPNGLSCAETAFAYLNNL